MIGQGTEAATYVNDKRRVFSAREAGETYGYGSPLHQAVKQLLPINGRGVGTIPVTVYPLQAGASAAAAVSTVTASGTATAAATYQVRVNNILSEPFTVAAAATATDFAAAALAAVNAILDMPVIATVSAAILTLTAKWLGITGNNIRVSVVGPANGYTFTITVPTAGAVNPTVTDALGRIGQEWETMVVNCVDSDTAVLTEFNTWGEGRYSGMGGRPAVVFTGSTLTTPALAIAVPDARPTERSNSQLMNPGSTDLPFIVAAAQAREVVLVANDNPPTDYGSRVVTGLTPGPGTNHWTLAERDTALKGGVSSIDVVDGKVVLKDIVTFYHPSGDVDPIYRHVVDVVKYQNILYNFQQRFGQPSWDGAPFVPDNQAVTNLRARQPKAVHAEIAGLLDGLGLEAIISDPAGAKETIQVQLSTQNPKRVEFTVDPEVSGNSNIISGTIGLGFYYGDPLATEAAA